MVNSFVMETLTKMIESLKKVSVEHEDYDMLAMFISTLKKFNENIDISLDQISQITEYFDYRWQNDRNHAVATSTDLFILDQLPGKV
jgi:hypothetical protein